MLPNQDGTHLVAPHHLLSGTVATATAIDATPALAHPCQVCSLVRSSEHHSGPSLRTHAPLSTPDAATRPATLTSHRLTTVHTQAQAGPHALERRQRPCVVWVGPAGADKSVVAWTPQKIAQRRDINALGRILMFRGLRVGLG